MLVTTLRRTLPVTAVAALAAGLLTAASPADAGPDPCERWPNNTMAKLMRCVTLEGVREHQAQLQEIADANGGTRASGTPGYDQSADYAADVFRDAGYDVTVQEFVYPKFFDLSPSVLEQVAPGPGGPVEHLIMEYSGSGDVTAAVSQPNAVTGCVAADFAGFTPGHVALISRGACTFATKATNAVAAGAAGVVIYNNVPGPLNGTLGADFTPEVPVVGTSLETGQQLAGTAGLTLRVATETLRTTRTTSNVLAESRRGDPRHVVMAGAHLDSVDAGPGINDNGSGVGAILESAQQLARTKHRNQIRFALWGAEESNLVGSNHYVAQLTPEQLADVSLYLNFDMIGSPNHVFFIYDGDDSDAVGNPAGPPGSEIIERTFERFYDRRDVPFKGTDFSGRSDYGPFIAAGVPAGGLFTGAEGVKTPEEAAVWGGTAGTAYDPCYHQACDTYDNNSDEALAVNADAVAHAVLRYARSTTPVDRVSEVGAAARAGRWGRSVAGPHAHHPVTR